MSQVQPYKIEKFNNNEVECADDNLAVEEPLEIQISFNEGNGTRIIKTISVTMRTPDADNGHELASGFLFTEGIIKNKGDIRDFYCSGDQSVLVNLNDSVRPDLQKLERHFYTSSSCGVCGKTSIEAVKSICPENFQTNQLSVKADVLHSLPFTLRERQNAFNSTGGLHASALFDASGNLIEVREDVGRHNALDKLIGFTLMSNMIPLNDKILLLSGRASFELIQKSVMAGIPVVCAVGAPSSLAVDLARERNLTLIGFLRNGRFNVYSKSDSVLFETIITLSSKNIL